MLLIAPLLPVPTNGAAATFSWDVFYAFDSLQYEGIIKNGYNYSPATNDYSVAFFPLFPLIIKGVMSLGLSFQIAGTIVNNLAFLGALIVIYTWVNESYGTSAARWTTAVLAWVPLSLFGTVIYTEGLYLLLSSAALKAFEQKKYFWTAISGALATATRPTGIALIGAFLIVSVKERRGLQAYLAGLIAGSGLFLYSLYCQIKFGDALAFINAQKAWRSSLGIDWYGWWELLAKIVVGSVNFQSGYIKDPWYLLIFAIIVGTGYFLWHFRKQFSPAKLDYGFFILIVILWILAGDILINTIAVLGGAVLLFYLRNQLSLITFMYGFCGLGLILASGGILSLSRIAYGIVSLSIAFGIVLSRYPRWGRAVISFFAVLLGCYAVRFAQKLWVA